MVLLGRWVVDKLERIIIKTRTEWFISESEIIEMIEQRIANNYSVNIDDLETEFDEYSTGGIRGAKVVLNSEEVKEQ
jgi:hypothetical protein